jgi:hypothetical protein
MDDLYLAVFRRGAETNLNRQQAALASDRPLHAFWETVSEPRGTRILLEFMGLAITARRSRQRSRHGRSAGARRRSPRSISLCDSPAWMPTSFRPLRWPS